MQKKKCFLVAGSALVDVIATIEQANPPINHLGKTTLAFGGCAYNMAMNLSSLGAAACFMSALNDGTFAQLIKQKLSQAQIRQQILTLPDLPDATYTGIFSGGEMVTAVSSTHVHTVDFSDDFINRGVKNALAVLATCDLAVATLNKLLASANKAKIPVYLAGISTYEAPRLLELKGHIAGVFMNESEANALCKAADLPHFDALGKHLNTTLVVTLGEAGVQVYGNHAFKARVGKISVTGNTLGAGDLFMAATVYALTLNQISWESAIDFACQKIADILKRDDANLATHNLLQGDINSIMTNAERDTLTQVLNRRGIERKLADLADDNTVYLAIIDLDHFKKINDQYGHPTGDKTLHRIAQVLKNHCRSDDLVSRWGGEEFVCVLHAESLTAAREVCERLRQVIANTTIPGSEQHLSVSIGLAALPRRTLFAKTLAHADQALYQAKQDGRNQVKVAEAS